MSRHPTTLTISAPPFTVTIEPLELAHHLCALDYGQLEVFLQRLSTQFQIHAERDAKTGRAELGRVLEEASAGMDKAREAIKKARALVKPR